MKNTSQSFNGKIRQELEKIEASLSVGINQTVLLADINSTGYAASLQTFRNALYKARGRRLKNTFIASQAEQLALDHLSSISTPVGTPATPVSVPLQKSMKLGSYADRISNLNEVFEEAHKTPGILNKSKNQNP